MGMIDRKEQEESQMKNVITDKENGINICESCVFDIAGCWPPLHCKVDVKKKIIIECPRYERITEENERLALYQCEHGICLQ